MAGYKTVPKYDSKGHILGYYHVYPDHTVFVAGGDSLKSTGGVTNSTQIGGQTITTTSSPDRFTSAPDAASAPAPPPDQPPDIGADPAYQARIARIIQNRDNAKTRLGGQRANVEKEYGITDASDPYNRSKMLQESYDKNRKATGTSLAARGQLYSGAMQNAQDTNAKNYNQSRDSLVKAHDAAINAIGQQESDVNRAAEDDLTNASGDALDRLLASRPDADLSTVARAQDLGGAADVGDAPTMQSVVKPKSGYSHVAKSGPRKGQSYNVVKSGSKVYHAYAGSKKKIRVK